MVRRTYWGGEANIAWWCAEGGGWSSGARTRGLFSMKKRKEGGGRKERLCNRKVERQTCGENSIGGGEEIGGERIKDRRIGSVPSLVRNGIELGAEKRRYNRKTRQGGTEGQSMGTGNGEASAGRDTGKEILV